MSVGASLVLHTGRFRLADVVGGDLGYHRGVAYTMAGGNLHGEGPFEGLPTYFGGLYPLLVAGLYRLTGIDPNHLISMMSWPAALAVPASFYFLGRRLWPAAPARAGATALVATLATGVGADVKYGWVDGILPGSANEWPLYPRDVALACLAVSLGLAARELTDRHVLATLIGIGAVNGIALTTHLQIGLYSLAVTAAALLVLQPVDVAKRLFAASAMGFTAVVVSAWWWIPRVHWVAEYGPLDLASHPGATDLSLAELATSLGWMLLLVPIGLAAFSRDRCTADRFLIGWLVVLSPVLAVASLMGDEGFITERRAWFLAGVPLVLVAGRAVEIAARHAAVIAVLTAAMVTTAALEAIDVDRTIDDAWQVGAFAHEQFPEEGWSPVIEALRHAVVEEGDLTVITGDADGVFVWASTGAQPYSAWLPGYVKVGFDLESLTGVGLAERVQTLNRAFEGGLPGLCDLARSTGAEAFVLRTDGVGIAVHDLRPGGDFRADRQPIELAALRRRVGPGLTYIDMNAQEALAVHPGGELALPLAGSDATTIEVRASAPARVTAPPSAMLTIDDASRSIRATRRGRILVFRFEDVDLRSVDRVTLSVDETVRVIRIIGYQPVEQAGALVPDGAVLLDPAVVCTPLDR